MTNTIGSLSMMQYGRGPISLTLTQGSISRSLSEKCYKDYLAVYDENDFDLMDLFEEQHIYVDNSEECSSLTLEDLSTSVLELSKGTNHYKTAFTARWNKTRDVLKNKMLGVIQ